MQLLLDAKPASDDLLFTRHFILLLLFQPRSLVSQSVNFLVPDDLTGKKVKHREIYKTVHKVKVCVWGVLFPMVLCFCQTHLQFTVLGG